MKQEEASSFRWAWTSRHDAQAVHAAMIEILTDPKNWPRTQLLPAGVLRHRLERIAESLSVVPALFRDDDQDAQGFLMRDGAFVLGVMQHTPSENSPSLYLPVGAIEETCERALKILGLQRDDLVCRGDPFSLADLQLGRHIKTSDQPE